MKKICNQLPDWVYPANSTSRGFASRARSKPYSLDILFARHIFFIIYLKKVITLNQRSTGLA